MEAGTEVQGYRVLRELGHGGFADVYEVEKGGVRYALKVIRVQGPLEQVDQELAIHSTLPRHPNVEQFYHHWVDDCKVYFVFELCDAGTLNDYLVRAPGSLTTVDKVTLLLDAARGLAHLHDNNVVHRDIKPDNILLVTSPDRLIAKIADFGVSRMCLPGVDRKSSQEDLRSFYLTSSCGSLAFEAPEVVEQHYTERCDVFSLGLVLYASLAESIDQDEKGRPTLVPTIRAKPFPNFCYAHDLSIAAKVADKVDDPVLRSIVTRMLKHNYHFRMTARQVVEELEKYLKTRHVKSTMLPPEHTTRCEKRCDKADVTKQA